METLETLVKLAWLYVLRNDSRSRAMLDRAEELRPQHEDEAAVLAMLEQSWAEYWRRIGDLRRALEHYHRALNIHERLRDLQRLLKTYDNLALIYADARDFARAIEYSKRVLVLSECSAVEPETLAGTHQNLGNAYFCQGSYELAIEHFKQALVISQRARLWVFVSRVENSLAEAHSRHLQALNRPENERLGDAHGATALAALPEGDAAAADAIRSLKAEILGPRDGQFFHRPLPAEFAADVDAIAEVHRQRAALEMPLEPADRIRAHLAIARAYAGFSSKECDAALALTALHGGGTFKQCTAPAESHLSFSGAPSEQAQRAALWHQCSAAPLLPAQCKALLQHLLDNGAIKRSGYAGLCGVSLATASRHLGRLAAAGLLQQQGKGRSLHYVLSNAELVSQVRLR
jgi:tetratricopeptide (TPR) repeat protein